jgi:hypothetical protein
MKVTCAGRTLGIAVALAVSATPSWAQATTTNASDRIELSRSAIQTRRQEIVQSLMELTPEKSERFWPVYREYRNEVARLGDERLKFIDRFSRSAATMTDQQSKELLDDWFKLRQQQLDLQKKYVGRFRKVLSGAEVARFYQIENALDTVVGANLQADMPMAGDSAQ